MYELMEHIRSIQIVQAEQSRRLDEQAYRIRQLEMKELQASRFESQRYLWGPGAVGSTPTNGLGFDAFASTRKAKECENQVTTQESNIANGMLKFVRA